MRRLPARPRPAFSAPTKPLVAGAAASRRGWEGCYNCFKTRMQCRSTRIGVELLPLTHSLSQFFRNAHHRRRRPDEHSRSTTFKGRIRPHSRATSEKTRMTYCTTLFHDHECMSVCTNQCTERVRLRCVCIYKERSLLSCPHLLRLLNLTLFLRNIFPFDFSNEETTFKPEICKVLSSGILQR